LKQALLVLLGAALAYLGIGAAIWLYGVLAVWSPFPATWWARHDGVVRYGSEALALIPSVVLVAYLLSRLFKRHAVISSVCAVALALAVSLSDALVQPHVDWKTLQGIWHLFLPFLILPPVIVFWLAKRRSNNRWRGP
jgi:polyferredoxin